MHIHSALNTWRKYPINLFHFMMQKSICESIWSRYQKPETILSFSNRENTRQGIIYKCVEKTEGENKGRCYYPEIGNCRKSLQPLQWKEQRGKWYLNPASLTLVALLMLLLTPPGRCSVGSQLPVLVDLLLEWLVPAAAGSWHHCAALAEASSCLALLPPLPQPMSAKSYWLNRVPMLSAAVEFTV